MASFTKKAIVASFLKMCAIRSPDKITVRDIVDDCEINRNTFYYYFQDIYALVEEVFCLWTEGLRRALAEEDDLTEGLITVTDWATEHKKAVLHLYRGFDSTLLEDYYLRATLDAWRGWVRRRANDDAVSEEAVGYIGMTCAVGFFSILRRWMKNSMREDSCVLVEHYAKTWLTEIDRSLDRYESAFGDSQRKR